MQSKDSIKSDGQPSPRTRTINELLEVMSRITAEVQSLAISVSRSIGQDYGSGLYIEYVYFLHHPHRLTIHLLVVSTQPSQRFYYFCSSYRIGPIFGTFTIRPISTLLCKFRANPSSGSQVMTRSLFPLFMALTSSFGPYYTVDSLIWVVADQISAQQRTHWSLDTLLFFSSLYQTPGE